MTGGKEKGCSAADGNSVQIHCQVHMQAVLFYVQFAGNDAYALRRNLSIKMETKQNH